MTDMEFTERAEFMVVIGGIITGRTLYQVLD